MKKINAHSEMAEAIGMLAFVNTALTAIHEQPGNYLTSEKESFGLQQILFHIEKKLDGIHECLTDGMILEKAAASGGGNGNNKMGEKVATPE